MKGTPDSSSHKTHLEPSAPTVPVDTSRWARVGAQGGLLLRPGFLIARVREDSLLRNSLFIMATMVVTSVFGFAFWLVAARLFTAEVVGLTAALIAAGMIVTLVASLGAGGTLIQSLPEQTERPEWSLTFWAGLTVSLVVSVMATLTTLFLLPQINDQFAALQKPVYASAFVIGTVAMTAGAVLDYAFLAERVASRMFGRNAVVAVGKLLATVLLAMLGTSALTLLGGWALAALGGLAVGTTLLYRHVGPVELPTPPSLARSVRGLRSRLAGHQLIGMGGALLPYLLPLLVTARLSASDNAYFYTTWMMAGVFLIIAPAVSQSLFAEGVHSPAELREKARSGLCIIGALLAPCIVGVLTLGGDLLSAFGAAYASHAKELLELVVLASIPDAITNSYVAVLRVQGRLGSAATLNLGMGVGTLSLSWALLPHLGISAVGWAFLTMQLVGCAFVALDVACRGSHRGSVGVEEGRS